MTTTGTKGKSAYISFDVDRIKEFVFAGQRPLDITGASELVKQLDSAEIDPESGKLEEWLEEFRPFRVIYAVGGSGLIHLKNGDRASELCNYLERRFRETTRTGACSAVFLPIPDPPPIGDAFKATLRLLGIRLQQRKGEKAGKEPAEAWLMGDVSQCDACGVHPSYKEDMAMPGKRDWLCQSCFQKRRMGRELRKRRNNSMELALSLNDISDTYIACLYADVNKAGKLLLACNEEQEVTHFSMHLFQTMQSVRGEIQQRFQSPVVGGDDLLLFLPARGCVGTTLELWKRMEALLTQAPEKLQGTEVGKKLQDVSLSIGLAVVGYQLPINFMVDMASALLESAKAASYKAGHSAIDYMLLKGGSPISDQITTLRNHHFIRRMPDQTFFPSTSAGEPTEIRRMHLTRRPYRRTQMDDLVRLLQNVKMSEWKSPFRSVLELFHSALPMQIYVHTRYQKTRNYLPDHLDELLHRVEAEDGDSILTTGIGDLLELQEMNAL